MRTVPIVLATFIIVGACSDPASPAQDATPIDARADAREDAGPCGDEQAFEAGVIGWDDKAPLAGVQLTVAATGTTAMSAPNGRIIACVPAEGEVELRFTHADFVSRHHWLSAQTIRKQRENDALLEIAMVSPTRMEAFYASVDLEFVAGTRTLLANAHSAGPGWPAREGLAPSITPTASSFVPSKDRLAWTSASASDTEGILFFAESAEKVTLSATACAVVSPVSLASDVLTSVDLACDP